MKNSIQKMIIRLGKILLTLPIRMLAAGKMFGQTNMDTDASREIPLSVVLQAEDK